MPCTVPGQQHACKVQALKKQYVRYCFVSEAQPIICITLSVRVATNNVGQHKYAAQCDSV
jgi:hypothetical protein